jgi:hypothetical protein
MDGIKFEQMGGCGGGASHVVYVHQLDTWATPEGPEHQPTDATKAIDANFHSLHHLMDLGSHQVELIGLWRG